MKKVIGVGETIFDIIFKNSVPTGGIPGGSVFNTMVSLGRVGINAEFISEIGNDHVGKIILDFMKENNISTKGLDIFPDGQTAISLAFLDSNSDANYLFYTKYPNERLESIYPKIEKDDIFILGSYYAIDPIIRSKIIDLLVYAKDRKAIIYYDPNFRKAHSEIAIQTMPSILENFEYADIVRGSKDDFLYMFGESDPEKIYRERISFYCPIFIYTSGSNGVELFSPQGHIHYDAERIDPVSTIGAGDNFNAGIIYGLLSEGITQKNIASIRLEQWNKIIGYGLMFAKEVCLSCQNYIGKKFASEHTFSANGI